MRIPSGSTDRKIAFVALDSVDLKTRVTGLSSFTVYRSRNGGAATAYTTPTVAELSAANMPGVYVLTVDEDTTVDSGHDVEEYVVHITASTMAPVTRALELERVKFTEGQSATVANSAVDADVERIAGAVVDTAVAQLGVKTVSLADAAITAAAIATNAIDADAVAADAVTEIQSGLATSSQVTAVQADTDDIQARLPAALVGGRMASNAEVVGDKTGYGLADGAITSAKFGAGAIDAAAIATDAIGAAELAAGAANKIRDAILSDATPFQGARIDAAITSRATPAQVNAEVLDVLTVDTFAEPGQGAPPATSTLLQKLAYLFKAWRNRSTQDNSTYKLYGDDASTVDQKAAISDNGSVFERSEATSGP